MKSRIFISILAAIVSVTAATAQVVDQHGHAIDTTDIYGERADSLDAAVFTSSAQGNYISRFKDVRTEVISAAGLSVRSVSSDFLVSIPRCLTGHVL